jgi:hypothetical protein
MRRRESWFGNGFLRLIDDTGENSPTAGKHLNNFLTHWVPFLIRQAGNQQLA